MDLVLAVSLEDTYTGGTQPAYQFAAVLTPTDQHTFRASYSLAPTIPNLYEKYANHQTAFCCTNAGNPNLKPQKLESYEVGYQGFYLDGRLRAETNLFYMDVDDLSTGFTTGFFPSITTSFDNRNSAIARGVEAKLVYRIGTGHSVYANYTFERITNQIGSSGIEEATPQHKVNLGGVAALGYGFSASTNAGYKDNYIATPFSGSPVPVPATWRLDARLAYRPDDHLEVFVAGKNLLQPQHVEFADTLEVPRTYYGGFLLEF